MHFVKRSKKASPVTPQIVTLIVDDGDSMEHNAKAEHASNAIKDILLTMQIGDLGTYRPRFILNLAKFGSNVTALAQAAPVSSIDLHSIQFDASSGETNMAAALTWAADALERAICDCRNISSYSEKGSPKPLVAFFTGGRNTGPDISGPAQALKSIPFAGGAPDVLAVGIGLDPQYMPALRTIASDPNLALIIDPGRLEEFLAAVEDGFIAAVEDPDLLISHSAEFVEYD